MRFVRTVDIALVAAALAALALSATGCARVVVNYDDVLKDGGKLEFPLKAGKYQVEMTASGDGASVEWQGAECPGTGTVKQWTGRCRVGAGGKLVVRNPSVLHLGADSRVRLKVTRQP